MGISYIILLTKVISKVFPEVRAEDYFPHTFSEVLQTCNQNQISLTCGPSDNHGYNVDWVNKTQVTQA